MHSGLIEKILRRFARGADTISRFKLQSLFAIALALPLAGCGEGSALSGVSMKIGACEVEAVQTLETPYLLGAGYDGQLSSSARLFVQACMRAAGFAYEETRCEGGQFTPRNATCYRFDGRVSTWLGTIF